MTGEYLHKKERPSYDGKAILACSVLNKMTKKRALSTGIFHVVPEARQLLDEIGIDKLQMEIQLKCTQNW